MAENEHEIGVGLGAGPGAEAELTGALFDTTSVNQHADPNPGSAEWVAMEIVEETVRLRDLLLSKNVAYGNSALDPVRIFSRAEPAEQIRVRIDDKLSRLARGKAAGEDVTLDLMGYLVLLRIAERLPAVASVEESARLAPGSGPCVCTSTDPIECGKPEPGPCACGCHEATS